MSKLPIEYLRHVVVEIEFLQENIASVGEDVFMRDETLQRAAARSLEVIGEAIKQVPEGYRVAHSIIDWKSFAGLRDKLIHHYFGVDYAIVWDIIAHELPQLYKELVMIIQNESERTIS